MKNSDQISQLESRLHRPERGENGYREGEKNLGRLQALGKLLEFSGTGQIPLADRRDGINTHVHTAKSFSYFDSPSDAVWQAYVHGIRVFGINDHYTLAGHAEFGEACAICGVEPLFSMEAVAVWEEAEAAGATVNDPNNPGRTYLTAKGVTRPFTPDCQGKRDLEGMNRALLERNCEMTRRLSVLIEERLGVANALDFDDVLRLTPHDQPTERHVAEAAAKFLLGRFSDPGARIDAVRRLTGLDASAEIPGDAASFQNFLRSKLLKSGGPAFVPETREAFIPLPAMVSLGLDLGAIPTYPILGNPITPWEEDLDRLFDRLKAMKIHAVEVIPDRNTRERLRDIVRVAEERSMPVFNGTEHNTKSKADLIDKFFFDDEFRAHFERGADVLIGHQVACAAGEPGYVLGDGSLPAGDREEHLQRLANTGSARRTGRGA